MLGQLYTKFVKVIECIMGVSDTMSHKMLQNVTTQHEMGKLLFLRSHCFHPSKQKNLKLKCMCLEECISLHLIICGFN